MLIVASALVPFPALGFDEQALAALALPGEGLWHDKPERLFAISTIYYTAMVFVRRLIVIAPWETWTEAEVAAKAQGQAGSSAVRS